MSKRSLHEEISKIQQLSEIQQSEGKELEFITPKVETSVYGLEMAVNIDKDNLDYEVRGGATVDWELIPVRSSSQLGYFMKRINSIKCVIEWREFDTEKDGMVEFDTTNPQYRDWQIKEEMRFESDGGIFPGLVEIDYTRKIVFVGS